MPPPNLRKKRKPPQKKTFQRPTFTEKELEGLAGLLKSKWGFEPREHQLKGVLAQLRKQDINNLSRNGKTAIAAGPHAFAKAAGCITIMVSPLIAIQNEQVSQL